jgi:benzoate-CoA ligase
MEYFEPAERFNLVSYFLEDNLERGRGSRRALVVKDRRGALAEYTYEQVVAAVNRAGNALLELGVEREQRVLLAIGDSLEFVAAWYATVKIGAVVACVNPLLPADDYAYYLEYSRASVAICDEDAAPQFRSVLHGASFLRTLMSVSSGAPQPTNEAGGRVAIVDFAAACAAASPTLAAAPTHRDEIAVWLFTSGTTGKPKAAVLFHQDFVWNAERYAKGVMQLGPGDRTMAVPKLFFGYATGSNLLFPFAAGATVGLFHERSRPEAVVEFAREFRPTALVNVPTTINGLLQLAGSDLKAAFADLRYTTSAGEALPGELYERWKQAVGCEILDGIGSAEMFHVFISNRLGDVRPGTLGQLVDGYQARLVGPDGSDVASGEMGTLWIGGGSSALCYWNDRQKSRATMRGDWIVTADQFRRDGDGYFHYCGRADDMLKVGGIFVSPLEIEDCLLAHSAVKECAVVGYAEDELVKVAAFVVPCGEALACEKLGAELIEHVKSRLARYKAPRRVDFVVELPRNDRGKVEKKTLRDQLEAGCKRGGTK